MEQFTISGTVGNFVNWVDHYGTMRRAVYIPHPLEHSSDGRRRLIHTINAPDTHYLGEIQFHFEPHPDDIDIFTVTAEPVDRHDPPRNDARDYLQEMAAAIRKRWQQVPPRPNKGAPIRAWSIYRFQMHEAGMRTPTHKEMASESGYQPKYHRNDYATYLQEIGHADEEENV